MAERKTVWPHAPPHWLAERGTYFVTSGTYRKSHHFRTAQRLSVLERGLLTVTREAGWEIEAWAVFSNHYHFIARAPEKSNDAKSLPPMLNRLHSRTAAWINRLEAEPGRKIWHNYRDTHLTFEKSYLARLNYVHLNPVKHGLVQIASLYPWCSARWFECTATEAAINTVSRFRFDAVKVYDAYDPLAPDQTGDDESAR